MLPYTIECEECGTRRLGRASDGGVVPVSAACRDCGSGAFVILGRKAEA